MDQWMIFIGRSLEMRKATTWLTLFALCLCVANLVVLAQDEKKGKPKRRAKPPKFGSEVKQIFFDDVFSTLRGERSKEPGKVRVAASPPGGAADVAEGTSYAWSKMISAATIEDEIKAIKLNVDKSVTTPSSFSGRGHKQVRRDFSILAVMFAIIGEFDEDVRWKKMGPAARDIFARSARNTKAGGNTNTYNEAKKRKADLQDLIGGASLQIKAEQNEADWSAVCDLGPLMQRLDRGFEGKMNAWMSSKEEFEANLEGVLHEAEIIAALAEVALKEGMDNWDDEEYADFAKRLKAGAMEISSAVKLNNYDQANKASGEIKKACTECHEYYR
jgi:hypothetical protein